MSAQTDLTYGEQEEADRHHFQRMRLVAGQLDVLGGQVVLPWGVGVGRCIIPGEKHTLELLKSKSNLKKWLCQRLDHIHVDTLQNVVHEDLPPCCGQRPAA